MVTVVFFQSDGAATTFKNSSGVCGTLV